MRPILGNFHLGKLRPVARTYLVVCPRIEPACGSETPLGDSTRVKRPIFYIIIMCTETRALKEGRRQKI